MSDRSRRRPKADQVVAPPPEPTAETSHGGTTTGGTEEAKANPDFETACRAPFTSLHVDQLGAVRPCCQSSRTLGYIQHGTLQEIWTGDALEELREAVSAGDLSKGCEHCEWAGRGDRTQTYAVRFDHDRLPAPGEGPVRLELAPSNACNLQCTMCNGEWSSSIRLHREKRPPLPRLFGSRELAEVDRLAHGIDELHLFGGEPLLMPEALHLLDLAAEHGIRCVITTNGSIMTERIERLLDRPGIDLVVSVDGTSEKVYESIRVGASWYALQTHLNRFQELAAKHDNRVDIAHCLITANWREFPDHLRWAFDRGLKVYVNDVLSPVEMSLHHLSPPELQSVVLALRGRQSEIDGLGASWRATWDNALTHLNKTLEDASSGERHVHLGQLSATTGGQKNTDETPGRSALAGLIEDRYQSACATIELQLDADFHVHVITASADASRFEIIDLDQVQGVLAAGLSSLLDRQDTPTARTTLRWDAAEAVEERRYGTDGAAITERRSIRRTDDGLVLQFDYWVAPSDAEEREMISAVAEAREFVEFKLDADNRLTTITPTALAAELGLRVEAGIICFSPADLLVPHLLDPPPSLRAEEVEPGLVAVELVWGDRPGLVALARANATQTLVRIARPATAGSTDETPSAGDR